MSLDAILIELPSATADKRFFARILDALLFALVFLIVYTPFVLASLSLLPVGILFGWSEIFYYVAAIPSVVGIIFALLASLWGTMYRTSETAQTLGMSIMGIAVASDTTRFKSKLLRMTFGWLHISQDGKNRWMGNEEEERGDTQIWRSFFVGFAGLVVLLSISIVAAALHLLLAIFNLIFNNSNLKLIGFVPAIEIPLILIGVFAILILNFGFLLVFYDNKRTLADHFLGVRIVDVSSIDRFRRPKGVKQLVNWFWGNYLT